MSGPNRLVVLFCVAAVAGCVSFPAAKKGSSFSFLNTYEEALKDYEQGRIMEARQTILGMDQSRSDYPDAQKLLKGKVEPARQRLLGHYSSKAEAAEKQGLWEQAMRFYGQAAEFSTQPAALQAKRDAMELMMRQVRFTALIKQRRAEDAVLLQWLGGYEVPRGVAVNDAGYARMLVTAQGVVEERADMAYVEARRYLRKGMPELAYIEAESNQRLAPGSNRAHRLMEDIQKVFPKGIVVPKAGQYGTAQALAKSRPAASNVSLKQVHQAMEKGDWVEAKRLALAYRREGGRNADRLLDQIRAGAEKAGEDAFLRGRVAFRKEQLQEAVKHWSRAVRLVPDNQEYVDALRRAQQLQDRLRVLKSEQAEQ